MQGLVPGHYFYFSLVNLLKFFSGPLQKISNEVYGPGIYSFDKVSAK